jgi:altronate dehydratase large subunit
MTTIQEKALGCVRKGGSARSRGGGLRRSCVRIRPGHYGRPGYDVESIAYGCYGAQVINFSTGRGNVVGFPIIPVIKVASNSDMYNIMKDNMDFNAGKLLEDGYDFEMMPRKIFPSFSAMSPPATDQGGAEQVRRLGLPLELVQVSLIFVFPVFTFNP